MNRATPYSPPTAHTFAASTPGSSIRCAVCWAPRCDHTLPDGATHASSRRLVRVTCGVDTHIWYHSDRRCWCGGVSL